MTKKYLGKRPSPSKAFDGETYRPDFDYSRLGRQLSLVWDYMEDSRWHYPEELEDALDERWASISARVRDFRKQKWGEHLVITQRRKGGLFRYMLVPRGSPAWNKMDAGILDRLMQEQRKRRFRGI